MKKVRRYGQIIRVKPEKLEVYKKLHANPWEGVNRMIKICNIQNYSIFYKEGFLFAYFEYVGDDFEADMRKMAEDKTTQLWWGETDICQFPIETAKEGEWWANMEEIYHLD